MSTPPSTKLGAPSLVVSARVVSRVIQGRALVLDPSRDEIQQLNEVGSHLWALLIEGGQTEESLARSLVERFEVELDEALSDVREFVHELLARGFLSEVPLDLK